MKLLNKIILNINFRGKGKILHFLRRTFLPREHIVRIKGYPNKKAMFRLNYLWDSESTLLWYPFPNNLRDELLFLKKHTPRPGHIFDVGANFGYFTIFFYHEMLRQNYKIFAFEPVQELLVRLYENVRLNGAENNIQLESLALHNTSGVETISLRRNLRKEAGGSSIHPSSDENDTIPITIPTTTIDEYCRENSIEDVSLIKVDTEGTELSILRGAEETIKRDQPGLAFEVLGENFGNDFAKARDVYRKFLEPLGYELYFQQQTKKVPIEEALRDKIVKNGNWWAEKRQ